jgi:hypothetical protein
MKGEKIYIARIQKITLSLKLVAFYTNLGSEKDLNRFNDYVRKCQLVTIKFEPFNPYFRVKKGRTLFF